MIFTEPRFVGFFLAAFSVHWALRSQRARKAWLLLCSYVFYAGWDWRFLSLILVSTLTDYIIGARIAHAKDRSSRKALLFASLGLNLSLLGFFKYYNFFIESASDFLRILGLPTSDWTLNIVLPVGISFYTFQTLSYTLDIYRGTLEPSKSLLDFALFVGFFPQLVAGPIVRACDFLPQLRERRYLRALDFRSLLAIFLLGFVKKACISDNISAAIDPIWAAPGAFSATSNRLAVALYHIQIYCDFSGYSDMAIACAGLLGYELPLNFDFPYISRSIAEFWTRWHLSLSTWFRDYVYIPLGGNRSNTARYCLNIAITFTVSGLWHGADWNYVIYGMVQAVLYLVGWWWGRLPDRGPVGRFTSFFAIPITTLCLYPTWILFRGVEPDVILPMLGIVCGAVAGGAGVLSPWWWLLAVGFILVHWLMKEHFRHDALRALPNWGYAMTLGAAVALALPFCSSGYKPFIYFQF